MDQTLDYHRHEAGVAKVHESPETDGSGGCLSEALQRQGTVSKPQRGFLYTFPHLSLLVLPEYRYLILGRLPRDKGSSKSQILEGLLLLLIPDNVEPIILRVDVVSTGGAEDLAVQRVGIKDVIAEIRRFMLCE